MGERTNYPPCAKCGRNHPGECLIGRRGCCRCGKLAHGIKESPHAKKESRDVRPQTQDTSAPTPLGSPVCPQGASFSTGNNQCQNQFYALPFRQEQKSSLNVVTSVLRVFYFDVMCC